MAEVGQSALEIELLVDTQEEEESGQQQPERRGNGPVAVGTSPSVAAALQHAHEAAK